MHNYNHICDNDVMIQLISNCNWFISNGWFSTRFQKISRKSVVLRPTWPPRPDKISQIWNLWAFFCFFLRLMQREKNEEESREEHKFAVPPNIPIMWPSFRPATFPFGKTKTKKIFFTSSFAVADRFLTKQQS